MSVTDSRATTSDTDPIWDQYDDFGDTRREETTPSLLHCRGQKTTVRLLFHPHIYVS